MLARLVLHLVVLFSVAPLLLGIITRVKAIVAGRRGSPLLQLYFDLAKLARKGTVLSTTTSWLFRTGPILGLVVPCLASLFIPFGALTAPISFSGDIILLIYLFGLARFFTVLAALDTGSSFEGMGAAREVTFSCLAEPTIFIVFIVMARVSGTFSLDPMFRALLELTFSPSSGVALILSAFCLFVVLLVENCRIPFDDPTTHLELTMIHEVMVLDHSGPDFGLILYGSSLKLFVMAALISNFFLPATSGSLLLDTAFFLGAQLVLAVAIGLVESSMARLRLIRIPQLLVGTSLLSFFALILLLR